MNKQFKSINGLDMLECYPLNFQIHTTYRDGTGPLYYLIAVGTMADMYSCVYEPEKKNLSITRVTMDEHDVLSFYVETFEQASLIVYSFALGNFERNVLEGTIYTEK